MVADLCFCGDLLPRIHAGNREKIDIPAQDFTAEQGGLVGQDDLVGIGPDLLDIDGVPEGNPETLALPDRVVRDALMRAQIVPLFVHKTAGPRDF